MTTEAAEPLVRAELLEDGAVLDLCLNRPKPNILSMAMMQAVSTALVEHQDDPHLKLVVLRGEGKHFSFGASVEEHRKDQAEQMLVAFRRFCRGLASCPVPLAALVSGQCLGGAFETILCCNLVFVTESARMGCPEVRLGVFPPVLAALGPIRLGASLSDRLTISAGTIDTEAALQAGFAIPLGGEEEPLEQLLAWYRTNLAPSSAFALRQATRATRLGSGVHEALGEPLVRLERRYVREVLESHDGNEGIEAFIERREASWTDS